MKTAVISEQLQELIAERKVLAALFTAYTFDPSFFELEVIPLLLGKNIGYSQDERVKLFIVREKLREAELIIDVYYDLSAFQLSSDCSPQMEYLCHGVNLGNRAFHGKVGMILLEDRESKKKSLLLGAGSNNLTRSGWWDNIECLHWEVIESGMTSREFINIVKEDVELLRDRAAFFSIRSSALKRINDFLMECKGARDAPQVHYFGLNSKKRHGSFFRFIKRLVSFQKSEWKLEVISPFFADDSENKEHENFLNLGVNEILLFLPRDEDGNAVCEREYFENIRKHEKVHWAEWNDETGKAIGLGGQAYRRLHAKIFHFSNGKQSWVFVGSVNYTYKALHENVEAGYLVQLAEPTSLLKRISDDSAIEQFADLNEESPGKLIGEEQMQRPELHLCFDWVTKQLSGRAAHNKEYEIEILNAENEPVIDRWKLCFPESNYKGKDTGELEDLLKNGSLVKVRGQDFSKENKPDFPPHSILLQQIGWTHKPLALPDLSATQILAIYAELSPERRQLLLIDAKVRELILNEQGGELSYVPDVPNGEQFFCEYAEIFNAFKKLRILLDQALDQNRWEQLDYYLTGTGVDSLPTLIDHIHRADRENQSFDFVSCYLILLSAAEIYRDCKFADRPNVEKRAEALRKRVSETREKLELENNSKRERIRFFDWYESEFFARYKAVEDQL